MKRASESGFEGLECAGYGEEERGEGGVREVQVGWVDDLVVGWGKGGVGEVQVGWVDDLVVR